jgi:purine-binding chemotaxis protein CheW
MAESQGRKTMVAQRATSGRIDWEEVRQKLARWETPACGGERTLRPDEVRRIMDGRARALAQGSDCALESASRLEVVVFGLANERYAIETRFVREVIRPDVLTRLPSSVEFLIGLTNLRSEVLAVMDLRMFLGIAASKQKHVLQALVLGEDRSEFGIAVDSTEEVRFLVPDQLKPPPASIGGPKNRFLRGVTGDALIVLAGEILMVDPTFYIEEAE